MSSQRSFASSRRRRGAARLKAAADDDLPASTPSLAMRLGVPYGPLPARLSVPSPQHTRFSSLLAPMLRAMPVHTLLKLACDYPPFALDCVLRLKLRDATLLSLARQLEHGPVGRRGHRMAARYVALGVLHHVIARSPHNVLAHCLKGELLLSFLHYGRNGLFVPRAVLQEALSCFEAAPHHPLPLFLKGRLMLTMEPVHGDAAKASLGKQLVLKAADDGCARALVFLAHRYEYPQLDRSVSFAADVPKERHARERFIVSLYKKAAAADDPDALNDLGTSYAQQYGGLHADFDSVVHYYLRAIHAGSLHAFDNLGTHYETGMGMRFPQRVDYDKALFYYRQGARKGCPKCAYNLGAAYEEGMSDTLPKDLLKAEKYYKIALKLGNDCSDLQTVARTLKDLCALYITKMKLGAADDEHTARCDAQLRSILPNELLHDVLFKVNSAVAHIIRSRSTSRLVKLLGEENARLVSKRVRSVWKNSDKLAHEQQQLLLEHLTGGESVKEVMNARKRRAIAKRRSKN